MMKRKLFTIVLSAAISVLSITGCKKDANKPGDNGGGSLKERLVGTYKMTELKLIQEGQTADILEQYEPCDRDNLYILKADMTSAVVDAGQQCDPSSNDTGTWSLEDDETLVIDGQDWNIESLNGNTLKMSVDIEQNGVEATLKMTYVKQ
jgi:hypothetical protein